MVLGMSPDGMMPEAGARMLSCLLDLGYADRLTAAIPVILGRCSRAPEDSSCSRLLLSMAANRQLRVPLRETGLVPMVKGWLVHRPDNAKVQVQCEYKISRLDLFEGRKLLSDDMPLIPSRPHRSIC